MEKKKQFKMPGWTLKRLVVLLFLLYLDVCCFYVGMQVIKPGEYRGMRSCLIAAVIAMITYTAIEIGIPYNWTCMEEVRKYLTFKELRKCLENESFRQMRYAGMEQNRNDYMEIYSSENWISLDGVMIPKNTVVGLYRSVDEKENIQKCVIFTLIGGVWIVGEEISTEVFDSFYEAMKTVLPEETSFGSQNVEAKKHINKIETKKDYMNLISNNT